MILAVVLTLIIYSAISTLIFVLSNENETILRIFGLGIAGWIIKGILEILSCFRRNSVCYILENMADGKTYKCKLKDIVDVDGHLNYIRKRKVSQKECRNIPMLDKEVIKKAKINCYRCKHSCDFEYLKCETDEFNNIISYNKFEKQKSHWLK